MSSDFMDLESKAEGAKSATLTLLSSIRSCQSSYDERIMEPLNDFLNTTSAFKDAAELLQARTSNTKTLQQIEAEIAQAENEIQKEIERQFQEMEHVEAQIKTVQRRMTMLESLRQVGDVGKWLAFGQRISTTSSPPLDWKLGEPLGSCKPPYPTEDMLRACLLFSSAHAPSDIIEPSGKSSNPDYHQKQPTSRTARVESEDLLDLDLNPELM